MFVFLGVTRLCNRGASFSSWTMMCTVASITALTTLHVLAKKINLLCYQLVISVMTSTYFLISPLSTTLPRILNTPHNHSWPASYLTIILEYRHTSRSYLIVPHLAITPDQSYTKIFYSSPHPFHGSHSRIDLIFKLKL